MTTYSAATYQQTTYDAAEAAGVPPGLYAELIAQSSNWNPYLAGDNGGIGLSQVSQGIASDMGLNAWSPTDNITAGALHLKKLFSSTGNWRDALAQYTGSLTKADSIIKASGVDTSPQALIDAAAPEGRITAFLRGLVQQSGLVVLALLLIAVGLVVLIWKGGADSAVVS